MKINSTKTIHQEKKYVCVYGPSGIGKTSLVKALGPRTLIFSVESGLSVLKGTELDYIDATKADDGKLLTAVERFKKLQEFMELVQKPETKASYDVLFIDSLTECAAVIETACKEQYDGYQIWGEYKTGMLQFLKFFRDLKVYDVVFTSLELRNEEDGKTSYMPSVGGKSVKETIVSLFDEVYRMVIVDGVRKFVCQPTQLTQAKTRCKDIGAVELADLKSVFEKLRKE